MTVTIPSVPTPVPSRADPVNFAARADSYHAALPGIVTAMNSQNEENNTINSNVNALALLTASDKAVCSAAVTAVNAQSPVANAAAAAASAVEAAAYASQAQATNPDSPIRLNPKQISANFTVPSGYNAGSVGPISIQDGITVTVSDHSTWSIQ
jgi:hypothetical protein